MSFHSPTGLLGPALRDASPVPCVVTNQGTERAVVHFVMNAVAGARRFPRRRTTKAASHILSLSVALAVLGLRFVLPEALRRHSGQLLRQRQSESFQTLRRPCGQLLRQRQSESFQTLRRSCGQLLWYRQTQQVRHCGVSVCLHLRRS